MSVSRMLRPELLSLKMSWLPLVRTRSNWRWARRRPGRGRRSTRTRSSSLTSGWSRLTAGLSMLRWTSASCTWGSMSSRMRSSGRSWRLMQSPASLTRHSMTCSTSTRSIPPLASLMRCWTTCSTKRYFLKIFSPYHSIKKRKIQWHAKQILDQTSAIINNQILWQPMSN